MSGKIKNENIENKEDLVQNDFIIDYGKIEDIGANIEPAVLYQDLIKRIRDYHPSEDFSSIRAAYELAYSAHEDQFRKNGEPYIIHPLMLRSLLLISRWIKRLSSPAFYTT